MAKDKKWFLLNVGGQHFLTHRQTLTKLTPSNSPLHRLSTNTTFVEFDRDEKGAYMIDRNPAYFQVVLDFLRHGHLLLGRDIVEEGVLLEAEYFNIPDLVAILTRRIASRSVPNLFSAIGTSSGANLGGFHADNYLSNYVNNILQV